MTNSLVGGPCTGPHSKPKYRVLAQVLYRALPLLDMLNSLNLDLTVQGQPRHVQTCSTWTSLYRDNQDMFKLVQLGPHCTGTQHVETCSTWTSLYSSPPDMLKLVQLRPHCTWTSQHIETCSTLTSLYRDN